MQGPSGLQFLTINPIQKDIGILQPNTIQNHWEMDSVGISVQEI